MNFQLSQVVLSLLSGFAGAFLLHFYTVRASKKACIAAINKELEFAIYMAIKTIYNFRQPKAHFSFKSIELFIYPNSIAKHPDLFCEDQTLSLMFIYNSFKTFNNNSKNGDSSNHTRLINLFWEDVITFFKYASDDIIPDSLIKYKKYIIKLTIKDDPPKIPDLFEL